MLCCMFAVLEVILSTLDRDLIPPTPPGPQLPPVLTPVTSSNPSSSSNASSSNASNNSSSDKVLSREQQSALLSAVGRYPAGHAPAAASSDELLGAYKVMQVRRSCLVIYTRSDSFSLFVVYLSGSMHVLLLVQLYAGLMDHVLACLPALCSV